MKDGSVYAELERLVGNPNNTMMCRATEASTILWSLLASGLEAKPHRDQKVDPFQNITLSTIPGALRKSSRKSLLRSPCITGVFTRKGAQPEAREI